MGTVAFAWVKGRDFHVSPTDDRGWEMMSQWVTCLLCNYEDLSSDTQDPCEVFVTTVCSVYLQPQCMVCVYDSRASGNDQNPIQWEALPQKTNVENDWEDKLHTTVNTSMLPDTYILHTHTLKRKLDIKYILCMYENLVKKHII